MHNSEKKSYSNFLSSPFDRRSFLGLAAAGAGAGVLGLTGCSPGSANATQTTGSVAAVPESWDKEADFIVVGSGTALTGAHKAIVEGASVIILEKAETMGGTTALSGGKVWIPCNSICGQEDTLEDAKAYMLQVADGLSTEAMIDAYLATGQEMIDFMAEHAGIRWGEAPRSDYHMEWKGATMGIRSLGPLNEEDKLTMGDGWTTPQIDAIAALGGELLTGTPMKRLVARPLEDGRMEVLGVVAESSGKDIYLKANKAVLLGAGGFDFNEEMKKQYLVMASPYSYAVPTSTGDGILAAQALGCDLSMMPWGWGNVSYVTEPLTDNATSSRYFSTTATRSQPGSIFVNKKGRRFMDEAVDYDSVWYGFQGQLVTGSMEPLNVPAWFVCDHACRETGESKYGVETPEMWGVPSDGPAPEWVVQADTLEELAAKVGIDPAGLVEQVERFNQYAVDGKDPEFHRGESIYDQGGIGRPTNCIGPITTPPFYAAELRPFWQGTKGGVKINEKAQAIHVSGDIIPRLYACGNNSGCGAPGKYYNGAGGTTTPGMISAFNAAKDMLTLEPWE